MLLDLEPLTRNTLMLKENTIGPQKSGSRWSLANGFQNCGAL